MGRGLRSALSSLISMRRLLARPDMFPSVFADFDLGIEIHNNGHDRRNGLLKRSNLRDQIFRYRILATHQRHDQFAPPLRELNKRQSMIFEVIHV
jgi:hypothetical protein